jgi:hypothetical protein
MTKEPHGPKVTTADFDSANEGSNPSGVANPPKACDMPWCQLVLSLKPGAVNRCNAAKCGLWRMGFK